MTCYKPMTAWRSIILNSKYKSEIAFNPPRHKIGDYREINLPCGQCIGCRLERSRQWAIRCVHEASLHDDNCFITLTYDDNHLPKNRSINKRDMQLFWKKLRKEIHPKKLRYYMCAEYGDTTGRPHYHACVFGYDFPDKTLWKIQNEQRLYTSEKLNQIWGMGYVVIGNVTFESAAYVARYIMKKITGKQAEEHYTRIDDNGEVHNLMPEYTAMSRRPGIARNWFEQFKNDVYVNGNDNVVLRGREMKPPKYYDGLYEITNPLQMEDIKHNRAENAKKHLDETTKERLAVKEVVKILALRKLVRQL